MKNSYTGKFPPSNHLLNHEPTPAQSPQQSWNHQGYLNNGDHNLMEDVLQTDYQYQTQRPQLPPLQPIQTTYPVNRLLQRQIPSLIKPIAMSSQRKANGTMPFNNRQKHSNVPELHPIQRSMGSYNGDSYYNQTPSTQQPKTSYTNANNSQMNHVNGRGQPAFSDFSAAKTYYGHNSLSLKQNIDLRLKENVSENCGISNE